MQDLKDKVLIDIPEQLKNLKIKKIKWPYGLYLESEQGDDCDIFACDWLESGWVTCKNGTPSYLSRWGLTMSYIDGIGSVDWDTDKFYCIIDVDSNGKIEFCYAG